jgi:hypothetical protein
VKPDLRHTPHDFRDFAGMLYVDTNAAHNVHLGATVHYMAIGAPVGVLGLTTGETDFAGS